MEIVLFEKITAAGRGAFYDKIGAIRDIGQNHILEMLALLLAEKIPTDTDRDRRLYRTRALAMLDGAEIGGGLKRAQYEGYLAELAEEKVVADPAKPSETETFFRIPFSFREGLWKDTKFVLTGGKALARSEVAASIVFRRPVSVMLGTERSEISKLTLIVQPKPSIELALANAGGDVGDAKKADDKKVIPYEEKYEKLKNLKNRTIMKLFTSTLCTAIICALSARTKSRRVGLSSIARWRFFRRRRFCIIRLEQSLPI